MNLRSLIVGAALVVACVLTFVALTLSADRARAEQPEITRQYPEEGAVLKEPALVLQMCFKNPVDVRDLPPLDEGDFHFTLTRPDGRALGMRIVFQPDGYGVAIYPGTAETEPPEGEWTWDYRVVDRATDEALEGRVTYSVNAAEGEDILQPPPDACLAEGATNQATAPVVTDPATSATPSNGNSNGDDDPGALTLALIAAGIAAAGLAAAVVAFLIRRRPGSEPPAPSGGGPGADQP
jgi:hypothetical protein